MSWRRVDDEVSIKVKEKEKEELENEKAKLAEEREKILKDREQLEKDKEQLEKDKAIMERDKERIDKVVTEREKQIEEDLDALEKELKNYAVAFRKTYKTLGGFNIALNIGKGILISSALAAVIPAVPILVALVPLAGGAIEVVQKSTNLASKRDTYKRIYRQYKKLHTLIQYRAATTDLESLLKNVKEKKLEIESQDDYETPFNRYMKRYNLDPQPKSSGTKMTKNIDPISENGINDINDI